MQDKNVSGQHQAGQGTSRRPGFAARMASGLSAAVLTGLVVVATVSGPAVSSSLSAGTSLSGGTVAAVLTAKVPVHGTGIVRHPNYQTACCG